MINSSFLSWRRGVAAACVLQLTAFSSCMEPDLRGDSQQSTVGGPSLADVERAVAHDPRATAITKALEARGCTRNSDSTLMVDSIVRGAYFFEKGYTCEGAKLGARLHALLGSDGEVIHVSAAHYEIASTGVTTTLMTEEDDLLHETVVNEAFRKEIDQQIGVLWFIYLEDHYQRGLLDSLGDDFATSVAGARSAQGGTCIECGMLDFGGSSCSTDCCSCFAAVDGCYETQVRNAGGREAAMNAYCYSWSGAILAVTAGTIAAVYTALEAGGVASSAYAAKELTSALGQGLSLSSLTNWVSGYAWKAGGKLLQSISPNTAERLTTWSKNTVIGASVKGLTSTLLKIGIGGIVMKYWDWLSIAMDMPIVYRTQWGEPGKQLLCSERGYCPKPDCTDTGLIRQGPSGGVGACCQANPQECEIKDVKGNPLPRKECPIPLTWDISYETPGCMCPQGLACVDNGTCHYTCEQPTVEAPCSAPPFCYEPTFSVSVQTSVCM